MSKWATIDVEKLDREIAVRAAEIDGITAGRTTTRDMNKAVNVARLHAEHNALIAVWNCISRPDPAKEEA